MDIFIYSFYTNYFAVARMPSILYISDLSISHWIFINIPHTTSILMSVSYLMMIICKLEENDDIEGDILKICSLFKFRVLCHLCEIYSMYISDILYIHIYNTEWPVIFLNVMQICYFQYIDWVIIVIYIFVFVCLNLSKIWSLHGKIESAT